MYKTVRHGENSLQYTILPQTEEILSNSGLKGKGRDYSPSIHVRRANRKFTLKFVLFIVIGVIGSIVFASIPIYSALYARRIQHNQHEVITATPVVSVGQELTKSRKKELKICPEPSSTLKPYEETIVTPVTTTTTTTTAAPTTTTAATTTTTAAAVRLYVNPFQIVKNEKGENPRWIMPALRSWKYAVPSTPVRPIPTENNEIPLVGTPSGSVRLLDHYMSMSIKPWEKDTIIMATVTPESVTFRNVFRYYSRALNPSVTTVTSIPKRFEDVLITTKSTTTQTPMTTEVTETSEHSKLQDLKDTILSVDDDDEFKESLEVDEVFSLPPLKPDPALPGIDSDEVTVSKTTDNGWYGARWPFVDTSSYFQWTGYTPGDNLLLPLLVAALSSIALVLLLALAVRRRKRSSTASAQIGKLTADLQADDNTNLLTAENPEENEE